LVAHPGGLFAWRTSTCAARGTLSSTCSSSSAS
jgi:hypothetical protein